MTALHNIVNLHPYRWDIYINNLKNPAKALTTAQKVAAVAINFILLGIPYFCMKAWSLHNEQGRYFLLNPKEVYHLKYNWVARSALQSDNKVFLKTVISMNFEAFEERLDELFDKYKKVNANNRFILSEAEKAELRHMKVLFEVMGEYIQSTKKSTYREKECIVCFQFRGAGTQRVSKPVNPIREKLKKIRGKMWKFWNNVLPKHEMPSLSYGACESRDQEEMKA